MYNKILNIIGNVKTLKKNSPKSLRKNITIDKNLHLYIGESWKDIQLIDFTLLQLTVFGVGKF